MNYSPQEVMQYVQEEDVKFIRLAFCDWKGNHKNISIMPGALFEAFTKGIPVDSFALGYEGELPELLYLKPIASTLSLLPWRPDHGRVVRMYSEIVDERGMPCPYDTRLMLKESIRAKGDHNTLTRASFILYIADEKGLSTRTPYDNAGYLDMAPLDKCENIRRNICLTLEAMGINPLSSCHGQNPGQNRISYYSDGILSSADNMSTFYTVVNSLAATNGLVADIFHFHVGFDKAGKNPSLISDMNPYLAHKMILEEEEV